MNRKTLEKKRRELWHAVMKISLTFKKTEYVAVVDATDPNHPVWLVENPMEGTLAAIRQIASGKTRVTQMLPQTREWLDSYGRLDSSVLSSRLSSSTECALVVGTVDMNNSLHREGRASDQKGDREEQ